MEANESPEDCCVREAEEETGVLVTPVREALVIYEYYEEVRYINHYFVCKVAGRGKINLTEREKSRGLEPRWLPQQEAIDLFSRHRDFAIINEDKRGTYLREYTALDHLRS